MTASPLVPDLALEAYASPYYAAIDALRKPTEEAAKHEPDDSADYLPSIDEIKALVSKLASRVRKDYDSTNLCMGNLAGPLMQSDFPANDSPYLPKVLLV